MSVRIWAGIILIVALACDHAPQPVAKDPPVRVGAVAYAVADFAREIGGDAVERVWILEEPRSPEAYQPSESDLQNLRSADILIVSGALDAWVLDNQGSVQRERGLVRLNVLPGVADVPGAALWLDPEAAKALADELARLLYARRPRQQADLQQAAKRFHESLASIRRELEPAVSSARGKQVGTLSPTYDSLLTRYEIRPVRLLDAAPHRLTDLQLLELKKLAGLQQIDTLVIDASLPNGLADYIAARTGLKLLRIKSLGHSAGGGSYLDLCRYNLQELSRLSK